MATTYLGKVPRRVTHAWLDALALAPGTRDARFAIDDALFVRLRSRRDGVTKIFEYRAQVAGKRRYLTLGAFGPGFGLAEARTRALDLHSGAAAARRGEQDHPAIAERQRREGRRSDPTIAELFDLWIADKRIGSPRKRGEPVRERTIAILRENFDADIRKRIGDAKTATIQRDALKRCVDAARKRGRPGAAAHVWRTLRGLVRYAVAEGFLAADPMAGIPNPRPYSPRQGEANAGSDADIVALLAELDESPRISPSVKLAIEFGLLTGARPGEVRLASLAEVDRDAARWTIPADRVKTGRTFAVELSPQALALLERTQPAKSGWLFPGDKVDAHGDHAPLDKMAVARVLARIADRVAQRGGKRLRPHDLRRTFRTLCSRLGVADAVSIRCLNQLDANVLDRAYNAHGYRNEMADAWNRVGAHIEALRAGGAQVVPIRTRA